MLPIHTFVMVALLVFDLVLAGPRWSQSIIGGSSGCLGRTDPIFLSLTLYVSIDWPCIPLRSEWAIKNDNYELDLFGVFLNLGIFT